MKKRPGKAHFKKTWNSIEERDEGLYKSMW